MLCYFELCYYYLTCPIVIFTAMDEINNNNNKTLDSAGGGQEASIDKVG
jgi:hypothetical protein